MERRQRKVAERKLSQTEVLRRWWSTKYKLPTNHPLFEDSYIGDLMEEWYGDIQDRIAEVETAIDEDPQMSASQLGRLQKRRNDLRAMLDLAPTPYTGDVVMDVWEMSDEPDWDLGKDMDRARAIMAEANARRLNGNA